MVGKPTEGGRRGRQSNMIPPENLFNLMELALVSWRLKDGINPSLNPFVSSPLTPRYAFNRPLIQKSNPTGKSHVKKKNSRRLFVGAIKANIFPTLNISGLFVFCTIFIFASFRKMATRSSLSRMNLFLGDSPVECDIKYIKAFTLYG